MSFNRFSAHPSHLKKKNDVPIFVKCNFESYYCEKQRCWTPVVWSVVRFVLKGTLTRISTSTICPSFTDVMVKPQSAAIFWSMSFFQAFTFCVDAIKAKWHDRNLYETTQITKLKQCNDKVLPFKRSYRAVIWMCVSANMLCVFWANVSWWICGRNLPKQLTLGRVSIALFM